MVDQPDLPDESVTWRGVSLSFRFGSVFPYVLFRSDGLPYPVVRVSTHTPPTSSPPTRNLTLGIFFSLITSSELRNAASCLCALFLPRRGASSTTFFSFFLSPSLPYSRPFSILFSSRLFVPFFSFMFASEGFLPFLTIPFRLATLRAESSPVSKVSPTSSKYANSSYFPDFISQERICT